MYWLKYRSDAWDTLSWRTMWTALSSATQRTARVVRVTRTLESQKSLEILRMKQKHFLKVNLATNLSRKSKKKIYQQIEESSSWALKQAPESQQKLILLSTLSSESPKKTNALNRKQNLHSVEKMVVQDRKRFLAICNAYNGCQPLGRQ